MSIKKGDIVKILQGKDSGKTGKVLLVKAKKDLVIVEGINIVKRHVKRQSQEQPGGIVEVEKPLHKSKVAKVEDKKTTSNKSPSKKTTKKSIAKKTK